MGSFFLGVGIWGGGCCWPSDLASQLQPDLDCIPVRWMLMGMTPASPGRVWKKPKCVSKNCCENFGDWSFRKIDHSESPQQHLKMISSQVILEAKRDDGELRLVPMDQAWQPTFRFKVLGARGLQSIETVLGFCFPNMTWCPGHAKWMIDYYSVWVHVLMLPLSVGLFFDFRNLQHSPWPLGLLGMYRYKSSGGWSVWKDEIICNADLMWICTQMLYYARFLHVYRFLLIL